MSNGNSGRQLARLVRWLILGLVPGFAFLLLLSVPAPMPLGEIGGAALEPVLLTFGRLLALGLTGWLVASQLLYTIAILTRTRWLADTLRPLTLPLVRRAVASLATITLSLNTITALAQTPPETTIVTVDHGGLRQEATPTPILQPLVEGQATTVCLEDKPTGSYSAPLTWLIRPGDHLWKIAGEHLTIVLDRQPTENEHARYWIEVVHAAQPVIRSGNPDLIYPGEQIPLPPTLDAGVTP